MNQPIMDGLRSLQNQDRVYIESLFASEELYWLTASVATGFALAEIQDNESRKYTSKQGDDMIVLFNEAISSGDITADTFEKSRIRTLDNLSQMINFIHTNCVFHPQKALDICAGFISYWLFTKLIEMEWQRLLEEDDQKDSYMFIDGIIADQEELSVIREKVYGGKELLDDEVIYLRSHWQASCDFFKGLQNTLILLDRRLIEYMTNLPKKN